MHKGKLSAIQYSPSAKRRALSAPFRKENDHLTALNNASSGMGEIFTHAAAQLSLTYLSEPGKQTGAGCNAHYRGSCNDPNSQ